ncbi:alpha/beta hydrolase [Salinicoccus halodurans]|uniref:S-formylglutathione hydrolase FrmB n=1 Tax=Salinicoccus halodurans TaxID=407035 RepID=A0A0F7HKM3_9STAP|nr:alpha/beta hydrolase family protein [Salinicoccus halodurans]AKG74502.1 tributyrin esterase [Salinicoccus halodurans]SFK90704.1 S-formylglutathione hydrolase FrmB [Salinicoccus halodurans]
MALLSINFNSTVLGKHHSFKVILPENDTQFEPSKKTQTLKTMLLLHGLSNDDSLYTRYTNVERFANRANLAVIMPSADHSFYTNMVHGHSYYDHILEVWDYAHQILPLSKDRKDNFIAGHSMGGFGTIQFAFKESGRFSKACFMSSATNPEKLVDYDWYDFSFKGIVGQNDTSDGTVLDIRRDIEDALEKGVDIPELYMMCGTEDYVYEDNLKFKKFLEGKGIDFKYEEGPGNHDWDYWNAGIEKAIDWFMN